MTLCTTLSAFEGLTYPRLRIKDNTLDDNDLDRTRPLDNSRHEIAPKVDLGALDDLPLEILSNILVTLDLRSLTDFRRVNQRAMQTVDSVPQYRAIIKHSLASLRGILSIETGSHISCQRLYDVLTTHTCESCDDFGGYIYILTCNRVCFLCFTRQSRYLPVTVQEAIRKYGLNREIIIGLPCMKSLSGCYSANKRSRSNRTILLDAHSAHCAGAELYGSAAAMQQHVEKLASERMAIWDQKMAVWEREILQRNRDPSRPMPRAPSSISAQENGVSEARRHMAVIHAPWLNLSSGQAEWGFHCVGCQKKYVKRPLHWRRKYTSDTFKEHIQQCGNILNGEHSLR